MIIDHLSLKSYRERLIGANPVFIAGTGRSGTKFITHLIGKSVVGVETYHEPQPRLLAETLDAASDPRLLKHNFLSAYSEIIVKSQIRGRRYVASSQVFCKYFDIIFEIFDEPLAILIVRDPYDFMASAIERGWMINNTLWDSFHKSFLLESSSSGSQLIDLARYWAKVNGDIFFGANSEVRTYKLESLVSSASIAKDMLSTIAPVSASLETLEKEIGVKVNASVAKDGHPSFIHRNFDFSWEKVEASVLDEIWDIVGPFSRKIGYQRRL